MIKKIMLIGQTGCGKTTLTQVLMGKKIKHRKTQALEYCQNILDTPGEYIENRMYYQALIVSSVDYDIVAFVQDSTNNRSVFPPEFASAFNKEVIGIITKIDCINSNRKRAKRLLQIAGAKDIFCVSALKCDGIDDIRKLLI